VQQRPDDGQAAEAGVEDADGRVPVCRVEVRRRWCGHEGKEYGSERGTSAIGRVDVATVSAVLLLTPGLTCGGGDEGRRRSPGRGGRGPGEQPVADIDQPTAQRGAAAGEIGL